MIYCANGTGRLQALLVGLFAGDEEPLCGWVRSRIALYEHPLEQAIISEDLEVLSEFGSRMNTVRIQQLQETT